MLEKELPGGYGGYEPVEEGVFFDSWNFYGPERSLYYLDPLSRKVTVPGLISDRSTVDWGDITRDGRMMIFAQVDREGSDIMLEENLRSAQIGGRHLTESPVFFDPKPVTRLSPALTANSSE